MAPFSSNWEGSAVKSPNIRIFLTSCGRRSFRLKTRTFFHTGGGLYRVPSIARQDKHSRPDGPRQEPRRREWRRARSGVSARRVDDYSTACARLLPAKTYNHENQQYTSTRRAFPARSGLRHRCAGREQSLAESRGNATLVVD